LRIPGTVCFRGPGPGITLASGGFEGAPAGGETTPDDAESDVRATETHTRTEFQSLNGHGLYALSPNGTQRSGGGTSFRPAMSVELEPGATAAGQARAALGSLEGRIHDGVLDDIRLLVSELVTNSVRHARAERELVKLAVMSRGRTVRVEVADGGTGFAPQARSKPQDEAGGWGLHLVDRLADRWGVETGRRTRVWFEIESRPA
jgi:anti-sigma regulatory factor (Ser/Thr protein kinase)